MGEAKYRKGELMKRLESDDDFRHAFWDDPQTSLSQYGLDVTSDYADIIKSSNAAAKEADDLDLLEAPQDIPCV